MSQHQAELLYDFGSPTSYLAFKQMPRIAERTHARLLLTPVLLGGIFKATGNQSPANVPAKAKWMHSDMALWARQHGQVFNQNPHFPINTISLMRGAYWATGKGKLVEYSHLIFDAMWGEHPRNLGDEQVLRSVLVEAGYDAGDFQQGIADPAVKDALKASTEGAIARGVFGCPTIFVGEQMFFGQDRLAFVEQALEQG